MNETTLFLAQIMGVVFTVLGFSFILKKKFYIQWFKHLELSEPTLFVMALVELTAGLAIVLNNNLWSSSTGIIISIIGGLMVFEGGANLLCKVKTVKHFIKQMLSSNFILGFGIGCIILGVYFLSVGYFG